jgi:colanic acid/amylovoran biosynthesis protein
VSIALLGITGFRNRGVEALTLPVVAYLLARSRSETIHLFSWSAAHDQRRLKDARVTFVPTSFHSGAAAAESRSKRARLKQMLKTGLLHPRFSRGLHGLVDRQLASQLKDSRLAIITGGDVYSSEYGRDSLLYYCSLIMSAKAARLPVVLLGHTVGRFTTSADEKAWRQCVSKIDLLTTRDQFTYDYLKQIDGLAAQTEVCADVAFGLAAAQQIPIYQFPDPSLPCIAVSISSGLHQWCALSAEEHRLAWLKLITSFLVDWKVNVLIVPHVQESYGDDRELATSLHRQTGFDRRVWVAGEDLNASEYKGLISGCQMVVAERMHAAIAGLSAQVPTVMVAYSLKVEGIAAMAYASLDSGPDSMIIKANTLRQSLDVMGQLKGIWQRRQAVQECLSKSIPAIQALASKNYDHLGTLMDRLVLR